MTRRTSNPPLATYRVQVHSGFGFDACAEIAGYLGELGVSHLYSSPCLQAAPGSTHGYDVIDYARPGDDLGGEEAMRRMDAALAQNDLGVVLDIVPNHMGTEGRNPWWRDVLENGQSSRYAEYFDVDWHVPQPGLRDRVLLPILGDRYSRLIEAGKLRVMHAEGCFTLHYEDNVLPIAPESLRTIIATAAERCRNTQAAFAADVLGMLPFVADDPAERLRRHRVKEQLEQLLQRVCRESPAVAQAIDQVVAEINRDPDALDALIDQQNYRLAYWRSAESDLNYRRFFNIAKLVALRMENAGVFASAHELPLRWVEEGRIHGLRVDHIDGLRDPREYLDRLREHAGSTWIVVEKILEPEERLPAWPVSGTTGYDFLCRVNGLFVDPRGEEPLTQFYERFTGQATDFRRVVNEAKRLVLQGFGGEMSRLTALMMEICRCRRRYRDYTSQEIREALAEVVTAFPIYRTYVRPGVEGPRSEDTRCVAEMIASAKAARPDLDAELFDLIADMLLLNIEGSVEADLVLRLQQLTGAVMAKGVEDTAFYRYNRFLSLNEVGGDPSRFGLKIEEFHRLMTEAQRYWPDSMLATSTHDTKRSEDVRARLDLLSEVPQAWAEAVERWAAMNEKHHRGDWPDRNTEYALYQTLVGAWPLPLERLKAYVHKATHEAKQFTSWIAPNAEYNAAMAAFAEAIMSDAAFLGDLEQFVRPLVWPGRLNALSQTLIKLTAPGVPDIYQGTELWDLSLVDPDNRRPVDFDLRRRLLERCRSAGPEEALAEPDEGLPKLWLIRKALELRARRPELFGAQATYAPVEATGARAQHVVAFRRATDVVAVAPRLVIGLGGDWADTALPLLAGEWRNALTGDALPGGTHQLAGLLRRFPVALLEREKEGKQ